MGHWQDIHEADDPGMLVRFETISYEGLELFRQIGPLLAGHYERMWL